MRKNVKTTVGCIIENKGKILLTLRNIEPFKDYWCIPGGHIEFSENPIEGVKREIFEEVGLKINPKFLNYYNEFEENIDWHAVVLMFYARTNNVPKIDEEEVKDLKWFTKKEIKKLDKFAFSHGDILEDFFSRKENHEEEKNEDSKKTKKDFIKIKKERIKKIIEKSYKLGNTPQTILEMMNHHTGEIKELYKKNDNHFAVETGDLLVLAIELLMMKEYDVEKILDICYDRFDNKLDELIEKN